MNSLTLRGARLSAAMKSFVCSCSFSYFRFHTLTSRMSVSTLPCLAENTVKVHVTAILKKLECYSRTQAAVLVKSLEAEGVEPV